MNLDNMLIGKKIKEKKIISATFDQNSAFIIVTTENGEKLNLTFIEALDLVKEG
jgi:hypothetical protein